MPDLEMWGGVECTVARIGDRFRNQVVETGHHDRLDDLDRIAALGIRTVRYPIIWETIAPDSPGQCDWHWHDQRLQRLKQLGLRVIAGLMHHGSGPRYTTLLDPALPELLAAHAANVARRYPWIDCFTPVNEPLTTARLSGLYGHWYPHARDDRSFLRALLNQCRAIACAMRAIRAITPSAKLIQTEDVGKTFSTPALNYQAEFENARRWLSFDILCGRFDRNQLLYPFLIANGIEAGELDAFRDQPSTPDMIGVNHYLTSERFLHSRWSWFPAEFAGGNGRDRYADVEAVRMDLPPADIGPEARFKEVWQRYRLPMAVTEVHHGCTRDDQLRWLMEVWRAAARLREQGADIRAVTSWSLFGAVDWNSLLKVQNGYYEPGAFDARNSPPRLTAIGRAVRALALQGDFNHPAITGLPGWWRRPERLYQRRPVYGKTAGDRDSTGTSNSARLVVVGSDGSWLAAALHAARARGLDYALVHPNQLNGDDPDHASSVLRALNAWAVIDTRTDVTDPIGADRRRAISLACRGMGAGLALVCNDPRAEPQGRNPARPRDGALAVKTGRQPAPATGHVQDDVLVVRGGPDAIDVIIDLLIDGEHGMWTPTPAKMPAEHRADVPGRTPAAVGEGDVLKS